MKNQKERLSFYITDTYNTPAEFLWASYPDFAIHRHPLSQKWFSLFMNISKNKLIPDSEGDVWVLNIKTGPVMTGALLSETGIYPAYHMNKANWISIILDDTLPDEKIFALIDLSYDLVSPKIKKKK